MGRHQSTGAPLTVGVDGNPDPSSSRRRRILESVAFVGLWVVAGYLLPISSNGYLLLGIPMTFAFQAFVRRRPLRELFAGNAARFAVDGRRVVVASILAIVPAYFAAQVLATRDWVLLGWYVAAIGGAVCAAFALGAMPLGLAMRSAVLPTAVGATGMAAVLGALHAITTTPLPVDAAIAALVKYTALYFPATFLLEEVAFRGALDAHVHREGDDHGWESAVFVSVLWGLWHLPVSGGMLPFPLLLVELIAVHILLGVPLSLAWRKTRNLAGPAFAHAVIDAVRNAFMLGL